MTSASSRSTLSSRTLTTPPWVGAHAERAADRGPAQVGLDQDHRACPRAASEAARLIAVVVLPSDGDGAGDEDRRAEPLDAVRGGHEGRAQRPVGLGAGGESAVGPSGPVAGVRLAAGSGRGSAGGRGGAAAPRGAAAGRAPASAKAAATPRTSPAISPPAMLRSGRGETGASGGIASVSTRMVGSALSFRISRRAIWSGERLRAEPAARGVAAESSARSWSCGGPRRSARGARRCARRRPLGEGVGELRAPPRARRSRRDRDEVALRDRLGGDVRRAATAGSARCRAPPGRARRRRASSPAGRRSRRRGSGPPTPADQAGDRRAAGLLARRSG